MARSLHTSPRKSPRQDRSKATVDILIKAMTRVLIKDGWEAASTNRVAQEAGVSVGSLYQYFPSKEALVLEVMERHATRIQAQFQARMAELSSVSFETAVRELVQMMIATHQLNPGLHRVLIEQVPKVGALGKLEELNRVYERMLASMMEWYREDIEVKDLSTAAYIVVQTAVGLCHHAVCERPQLLQSGKLGEHLERLLLGYLKPSLLLQSAPKRAPPKRKS